MLEGEVVRPSRGETVTCVRSGLSGGPFIFEVELAPGRRGPPMHTHDEEDEVVEMLEGSVAFRVNGRTRILRAVDSLTVTPADVHTFWNPSTTERARARVTHGPRFERFIVQPGLLAMLTYLEVVDPGASRVSSPVVRLVGRIAAWVGRLRGVRLVGVDPVEDRRAAR